MLFLIILDKTGDQALVGTCRHWRPNEDPLYSHYWRLNGYQTNLVSTGDLLVTNNLLATNFNAT